MGKNAINSDNENQLEWISQKEFSKTAKSKNPDYFVKMKNPSGDIIVCKCYNKADKEIEQGGRMNRRELLELFEKMRLENEQKFNFIISTINANNAKQNEILQDLISRVSKLEEIVTKQAQDITELKNDVAQLKVAVKELSLRMDILEAKVDDLSLRVTGLEKRVTSLEGRITNLEDRITNLEDRITSIENRVTKLEEDKK